MAMLLMTPGPTRVPERVLLAGARPMIHHRDSEFSKVLVATLAGLRPLFGASGDVIPVHASGRGAMEASICNLLSPGDEVLACANGRFGQMWAEIAESFGVIVHRVCTDWGASADPLDVENGLKAHPKSKALLMVHSETSTGVLNNVPAIVRAVRPNGILVMVDCVSSLGGAPVCFDAWDIDVAITASQKCLMSSAGLSFVALSERAWAASKTARLPRAYFNFEAIRKTLARARPETPGTTPVHLFFQVNEALSMIYEEGLENTFARHKKMGRMVQDWVGQNGFSLANAESECLSPTLTAICAPSGLKPETIREQLKQRGILTARGLGPYESNGIRIGHLGDIQPRDVQRTLDALSEVIAELEA
jgi:aspartate aminotransferase-like enzyme